MRKKIGGGNWGPARWEESQEDKGACDSVNQLGWTGAQQMHRETLTALKAADGERGPSAHRRRPWREDCGPTRPAQWLWRSRLGDAAGTGGTAHPRLGKVADLPLFLRTTANVRELTSPARSIVPSTTVLQLAGREDSCQRSVPGRCGSSVVQFELHGEIGRHQ